MVNRHRFPEIGTGRFIRGIQDRYLAPRSTGIFKDIDLAGGEISPGCRIMRPNERCIIIDRDGYPEIGTDCFVRSIEDGDLAPGFTGVFEDICPACRGIGPICPDNRSILVERDGCPETSPGCSIRSVQDRYLAPGSTIIFKEYSDKPRIISKLNGIDPNQITKCRIFLLVFW